KYAIDIFFLQHDDMKQSIFKKLIPKMIDDAVIRYGYRSTLQVCLLLIPAKGLQIKIVVIHAATENIKYMIVYIIALVVIIFSHVILFFIIGTCLFSLVGILS